MDTQLVQTLQDIGLSENQSRVYLASLALGPSKATEIAARAEIKRTTVYPVIDSLKEMGLISINMRGWKKLYSAEHPNKLDQLASQKYMAFKKSIGQLSALHRVKPENNIKYYEGKNSFKNTFNSLLEDINPGENYYIIASGDNWYNIDPEFFRDFIDRRSKLDINIRCLMLADDLGQDYFHNQEKYNLQIKFFPKPVSFSASIVFIPKKVVISHLMDSIWNIVIEDRNIVQVFSELFESIWESLPEIEMADASS